MPLEVGGRSDRADASDLDASARLVVLPERGVALLDLETLVRVLTALKIALDLRDRLRKDRSQRRGDADSIR